MIADIMDPYLWALISYILQRLNEKKFNISFCTSYLYENVLATTFFSTYESLPETSVIKEAI
jgi:hypothetical protein